MIYETCDHIQKQDTHVAQRLEILNVVSTLLDNEFYEAAHAIVKRYNFSMKSQIDREALGLLPANQKHIQSLIISTPELEYFMEYRRALKLRPDQRDDPFMQLVKSVFDNAEADDEHLLALLENEGAVHIDDEMRYQILALDAQTKRYGAFARAAQIAYERRLIHTQLDLPESFGPILHFD